MKKSGATIHGKTLIGLSSALVLSISALTSAGFVFAQNVDLQNKISLLSEVGSICGPAGQDGATGPAGPCGPLGNTGPCGPQGETGATGATGPEGEKGETGATGATGPEGEKGETGATGATGTAGRDGIDGITTLGFHGAFFDTTNQFLEAGTAGQAMRLDSSDPSNCGVYVPTETTSRIYVSSAGVYNLQFSAQLRSDSNQSRPVDIWLSKNGESVDFTNTQFFAPDRKGIYVAAWNFLIPMAAGDYVELMWYSSDSTVYISQLPAQISPPIPAVPSLIATLTQVG